MHSPKLPMDSVKASILAQNLIILKYSIMFRCFVSSCVLLSAQPPRSVLYSTVSSKYLGDDWIILSNIPSYSTASAKYMKMSEHSENATEKIMSSIMDTIADKLPKQKSGHFDPGSVSEKVKSKLFGRQRSLHGVLGGGKSADVLLWRNKKISSSVLALATAIWVFFEWLDYHFLTIISFSLVLGMVVQFVWSNFSSRLSGSSNVPRVELPDELFVNIAVAIGAQVNKFLSFLQDVSCERNLKHFVLAIVGLWAAAVAGSWFNFLTVIYIGFVCAHTLPVLYEKYDDQIDDFLYSILGLLRDQYQKLDQGVLSRIPKGNMKFKKSE